MIILDIKPLIESFKDVGMKVKHEKFYDGYVVELDDDTYTLQEMQEAYIESLNEHCLVDKLDDIRLFIVDTEDEVTMVVKIMTIPGYKIFSISLEEGKYFSDYDKEDMESWFKPSKVLSKIKTNGRHNNEELKKAIIRVSNNFDK